jgi:uncharacterized protein (TIGR03437 family)
MKKLRTIAFLLPAAAAWQAAAQSWDTSGNGMLSGAYYFRQVVWIVGDNTGDLSEAISLYGQITFDGHGNYTITNQSYNDSANSAPSNSYSVSGTYAISASGYGSITSPISNGDAVYGLVSQGSHGIFIGSSTENGSGFNDIFVAAPLTSPAPTNATFTGIYNMVDLDFTSVATQSGVLYNRQSTFQLNPNGSGNIGSVKLTGSISGSGTNVITQSISSVPYFATGGAFNLNFGNKALNPTDNSHLIAGTKYLYISPDGNFVFGGDPQYAWDMILGVRQGSGTPKFNGLYYQAGVFVDNSQLASNGYIDVQTQYGSLNESSGVLLEHQRDLSPFQTGPIDYTYSDAVTANPDGTYNDSYNKYFFGAGGAIGVAIGTNPYFAVTALVQAPSFTAPNSPFIFPTGIVNAGSSVPFTASLAPGELVSIYGANLTTTTTSNGSLPTTLGGVQVLVNNTPAPIYSVAHTSGYDQINAVIPLSTNSSIAAIQVTNGNGSSNTVTNYVQSTQPGAFNSYTATPAVQHGADYSMVTPSNPAHVGETLLVYLTGLGTLTSSGNTNASLAVYIDGIQASVSFAGSQSSVGGGYQMNVVVPSGVSTGDVYLDIAGPDAYNSEVVIPVGTAGAAIKHAPRMKRPSAPSRATPKRYRAPGIVP